MNLTRTMTTRATPVSTPSPDDWDPRDRHRPHARELLATVPRLARGDGAWPSCFDTPLVVNPRSVRRDRRPLVVRASAIVLLARQSGAGWDFRVKAGLAALQCELSRHQLHTGQRNRVIAFRRGDDSVKAVALFPDAGLEGLAGEHHAGEPGAVAANS